MPFPGRPVRLDALTAFPFRCRQRPRGALCLQRARGLASDSASIRRPGRNNLVRRPRLVKTLEECAVRHGTFAPHLLELTGSVTDFGTGVPS
jgi:hypothetical protein